MTSQNGGARKRSLDTDPPAEPANGREFHNNKDWSYDLVQNSCDLLCIHDLEGRLLSVNPEPARLLGYTVEELLRIPMRELAPPEFRANFDEYLVRIARDGKADGVLSVMTRSGEQRFWEYHNTLHLNGNDGVVHGIAHDVTEHLSAEAALHESSRKLAETAQEQEEALRELKLFRALVDQASEVVLVIDGDTLRLLDVNQKACSDLGYTREELLLMTVPDIAPDVTQEAASEVTKKLREGGTVTLEGSHRRKNGTIFPIEVTIKRVRLDREYMVALSRDITERKRDAELLRESEERFRAIYNRAPVGVSLIDVVTGRFLQVNPKYCEIVGRTEQELRTLDFQSITHPDDWAMGEELVRSLREGTASRFETEKRYIRPDGSIRWVRLNVAPMWRPGEHPTSNMGISEDITDRKEAAQKIQASEQRFRTLAENFPDFMARVDREERLIYANPTVVKAIGLPLEALVGRKLKELETRGNAGRIDSILGSIRRVFAEGKPELHEAKWITDDGERYYEIRHVPELDANGNIVSALGITRDVTERRKAEDALRESEKRLRLAQEAACIGSFERDLQTGKAYWSPQTESMFGLRVGAGPESMEAFLRLVHPWDRDLVANLVSESVEKGVAGGEWRVIWPDGSVHWIAGRWMVTKDDQGRPLKAVGMDYDITERKRAEEELRRSEERYRSLVEATSQVVWTLEAGGEAIDVPIWCSFTGQTPDEARGEGWLLSVHPEDREATKQAWSDSVKNRTVYERQHRVRGRDGEYRFLAVRGVPVLEKDGRVREWIGTCTDITQSKKAEEALWQSEERFRVALKNTPIAVFNQDRDLRYTWIYNSQLPLNADEKLGKSIEELFEPEEAARIVAERRAVLETGVGRRTEQKITLKGRTQYLDTTIEPVHDSHGSVVGLTGASMDVTELRQVTEALREAKEKLTEEKLYLEQAINTEMGFEEIVGHSAGLKSVMEEIGKVATSDATVLLLGETGVGKELVARAIHRLSWRNGKSFIKMNCAAIPSGLLESELFGAEAGAYTSANTRKIGRLELADQGTLFLDEIGEIALDLQPKLLRVLQDHEFERLGDTKTLKVDFRLIAATNRDLAESLQKREFRSDLYYRLNVFPIRVPPLRERRDDIPSLVEHFVRKSGRRMNKVITSIPKKTMKALMEWNWPGNVRELENFVERSVILTRGSVLAVPLSELRAAIDIRNDDETLAAAERQLILRALRESGGKISGERGAAARLGLKRTTLQSKLKILGIHPREVPARS